MAWKTEEMLHKARKLSFCSNGIYLWSSPALFHHIHQWRMHRCHHEKFTMNKVPQQAMERFWLTPEGFGCGSFHILAHFGSGPEITVFLFNNNTFHFCGNLHPQSSVKACNISLWVLLISSKIKTFCLEMQVFWPSHSSESAQNCN